MQVEEALGDSPKADEDGITFSVRVSPRAVLIMAVVFDFIHSSGSDVVTYLTTH